MSSVLETEAPLTSKPRSGVVAYLNVDGAMAAAEFYKKAFGAKLLAHQPLDDKGRTMHVHLEINGASVMLSDFFPEHGHGKVAPQGFSLVLISKDIENDFRRAVEAGAEVVTPVQKMFWGDYFGALKDPFGVAWAMNQGDE